VTGLMRCLAGTDAMTPAAEVTLVKVPAGWLTTWSCPCGVQHTMRATPTQANLLLAWRAPQLDLVGDGEMRDPIRLVPPGPLDDDAVLAGLERLARADELTLDPALFAAWHAVIVEYGRGLSRRAAAMRAERRETP